MRRRLPWLVLAVVLLASAALHADRAWHPSRSYQSADERSYGRLALAIAEQHQYGDRGMQEPLHWPPGYPALLALAHRIDPDASTPAERDIGAGYWAQALVGVATVGAIAALVWLLAGARAAVGAAALLGLYPPAILQTGEQVSEPLGGLVIALFALALAQAARTRSPWWWGGAGALLGGVALVRADYVFLPAAMVLLVAARFLLPWRSRDWRRALLAGGMLALGAALALAPWTIYASDRAGELVPVTVGGGAALFVGTYLPGNGTTVGMKRHLGAEVKRAKPSLAAIPDFDLPAAQVLAYVARRHPDMERNKALQREARANLVRYGLKDPIDFAGMMANKVWRMWSKYARGGARHTSWVYRTWHILLVLAGFAGLVLGVWRGRSTLLAALLLTIAYATALHTITVSQARYNGPLMPILIGGGVAGWVLWWRARRTSPAAPAPLEPGRVPVSQDAPTAVIR